MQILTLTCPWNITSYLLHFYIKSVLSNWQKYWWVYTDKAESHDNWTLVSYFNGSFFSWQGHIMIWCYSLTNTLYIGHDCVQFLMFITFIWFEIHFTQMWDNQAKWVWTRAHHIFSFLLDVILHSKSYVLQKTPLKLDILFKSYDLWVVKTIENKQIYFFCLALSPNQYLKIPTHFAWSYYK